MNPKSFLVWGGVILVLVGVLGMVGVLGPTAEQSIFGAPWWFDGAENWAHLVLGIVALLAAFALPGSAQRPLVMLLGIVGLLVALWSLFVSEKLWGANLERVMDTILHAVVGVWALLASRRTGGA